MKIAINPTKIIVAMIFAVLASIVIQNLVAVSEFSAPIASLFTVIIPVLIGLGAATKAGNKKPETTDSNGK